MDLYSHISVVCVVDPKANKLNAANIEYNEEQGRFDLVYLTKDQKQLSPSRVKSASYLQNSEPAAVIARRNREKPKKVEDEVIDLSKYGDNPDYGIMTSPEKKKYRQIL